MSQTQEIAPTDAVARKPRDDELDAFGLTDRGKVRVENQEHFLIGSLRKRINIRQSSLSLDQIPLPPTHRRVSKAEAYIRTWSGLPGGPGQSA